MWSSLRDFALILGAVVLLVWILARPNQHQEISRLLEPSAEVSPSVTRESDNDKRNSGSKISQVLRSKIRDRISKRMADLEYRTASREKRKAIREQVRAELHQEFHPRSSTSEASVASNDKRKSNKKKTATRDTKIAKDKSSVRTKKIIARDELRRNSIDAIGNQSESELERQAESALNGLDINAIDYNELKISDVALLGNGGSDSGNRKKSDLQMASDFFEEIDSYISDLDKDLE